jgi:VanZ family protein
MSGIFLLSHQTAPLGVRGSEATSTVAHLLLYAGLTLALSWVLVPNERSRQAVPAWVGPAYAFALAVLYGALDEVHQGFVAGRTASHADLGLDAAGAALGTLVTLLRLTLRRRRRQG